MPYHLPEMTTNFQPHLVAEHGSSRNIGDCLIPTSISQTKHIAAHTFFFDISLRLRQSGDELNQVFVCVL